MWSGKSISGLKCSVKVPEEILIKIFKVFPVSPRQWGSVEGQRSRAHAALRRSVVSSLSVSVAWPGLAAPPL